jgi:AraC-like DNA-binding protein
MSDLRPKRGDRLRLDRLYGGDAVFLPGETLGPRTMSDYELVWIIEGQVTYRLGDVDHDASPGTVILAQPGFVERYTWDRRHTTRHAYFHIDVRELPRDWPVPKRWPLMRWFRDDDAMRPLFRRVLQHAASTRDQRPTRRTERMVEMLIDMFLDDAGPAQPSRYPEAVERALGWLSRRLLDQPEADIALDDLADAAAVSGKHLCRLFAQSVGVSPMRAAQCVRLDMAMSLVTRSNLSMKHIAARCGYVSPFHFSRSFARQYNMSPTAARKHVAQGGPPPPPRDAVPSMRV